MTRSASPGWVVLMLVFITACTTGSSHESTARLFLDQYLVAADQYAAIQLTTGRAHADIQTEIDLLASVEDREQQLQDVKPTARFEKSYEKPRPNGDVAFLFRVDIDRSGVDLEPRDAFLLVTRQDEAYLLKSFSFRSPSDTHTPDTP
jgi:hypothetical protein